MLHFFVFCFFVFLFGILGQGQISVIWRTKTDVKKNLSTKLFSSLVAQPAPIIHSISNHNVNEKYFYNKAFYACFTGKFYLSFTITIFYALI